MHAAVPGARWHFIGTLQTNTAHHVAALADVVETVAGRRATERLARRAAAAGPHDRRPDRGGLHGRRAPVSRPRTRPAFADRVAAARGASRCAGS